MPVSLASSWCPGAVKGQLVAQGVIAGNATAGGTDVGPQTGGAVLAAIPLPATAFPGAGAAGPIPASNIVLVTDGIGAAPTVAGIITGAVVVNGVSYASALAAGNWFTMAPNTATATYQWFIYA